MVRVIHKAKSALERQTREAIRIQRRGGEGAILNSKAEFSRCYIPRLQLEEQDKIKEMEQEERIQDDELARELGANQKHWEAEKTRERGAEQKRIARELGEIGVSSQSKQKREQGDEEKLSKRANKKRRYELVGAKWGEQKENLLLNKMRERTTEEGA